ncbi:SHOCT domain-containing protein [Meridianimarinicoccus sp. MJW13]|uniref:SHOCT domain-containing protein n=1 Tax=Meridianimarinicoccus sp. MJW13 TaxID=2720031 RepID=UPI0018690ABF|nr:SHOCT domain-containing protein [Fluviibacterium sp. MJW13]
MALLTPDGTSTVNDIASRYGLSPDAVLTLLVAINNGGGTQAQFSHPELGGMGQWSMGGMVMVGDMFNNSLKFTVDQVCTELSNALAGAQLFKPAPRPTPMSSQSQSQGNGSSFSVQGGYGGGAGWPQDLGAPSSVGSQNNLRYAVFPNTRRLAIDLNGQITVYDIGDHQISGFSQQQGGDQSITFTSQYGLVRVADLPVIPAQGSAPAPQPPAADPTPAPAADKPTPEPAPKPAETTPPARTGAGADSSEIFALIEQLASLHDKGILTDAEFETKKTELLARL